jgi:hypothetical protein
VIPVVTREPYDYTSEEVHRRSTQEAPVVYQLD